MRERGDALRDAVATQIVVVAHAAVIANAPKVTCAAAVASNTWM